jgi:hypothetical protein
MISWIMYAQTPTNSVKFVTNEDNSYQILNYYKFRDFISQFSIQNPFDFYKALDSFETVFFNCETGEWKIEKPEIKESSFEQMLKLNPSIQEVKEKEKSIDPLQKKKNFLDIFSKERKKQVLGKKR